MSVCVFSPLCVSLRAQPFRILGLQQVAIGNTNKEVSCLQCGMDGAADHAMLMCGLGGENRR